MKKNLILWIFNPAAICILLAALSSGVLAKEEIKAPLLTGKTWINMSQDQKAAYIWGAGDIIDLEQEIMEIYPELKRESFVAKAVEGIGDVKINDIVSIVDSLQSEPLSVARQGLLPVD